MLSERGGPCAVSGLSWIIDRSGMGEVRDMLIGVKKTSEEGVMELELLDCLCVTGEEGDVIVGVREFELEILLAGSEGVLGG